jgi:Tol biopolymer transport system component
MPFVISTFNHHGNTDMTSLTKTGRATFCWALIVAVTAPVTVHSAGKGGGKPGGGDDPNTNYAIAFVANDAIHLTTIDGSQTQQLTAPKRKAGDSSPTWSPDLDPDTEGDQRLIAYLHRPDTDWIGADLMIMEPDGSNQRIVQSFPLTGDPLDPKPYDTNAGKTTLAWSPNGREIVFSASGSRLIAVDIATGNWRVLLQTGIDMNDPAISPLNVLSFVSQGDVFAVDFELDAAGLMQLEDSSLINLTRDGFEFDDRHATWSPDGTFLAVVRWVDSTDGSLRELVVLDILLGGETVLWSGSIFEGVHGEPTWSPDGKQIAVEFVERRNSGVIVDLVRVTNWNDPQTRSILSITQTNGTQEYEPAWNPGE